MKTMPNWVHKTDELCYRGSNAACPTIWSCCANIFVFILYYENYQFSNKSTMKVVKICMTI